MQEAVVHRNTQLAFSPSLIAGGELAWDAVKGNGEQPVLNLALLGKYVGRQYLDNTSNQQASLDPYAFADARIRWTFQARKGTELQMTLLVNNLLNAQYAANGWAYRFLSPAYDPRPDDPYAQLERGDRYHLIGLYPQAGRHFLLGLTVSF